MTNVSVPHDCTGLFPSIPHNLTATPVSASAVNLSWTAATDDAGVVSYNVYRDGDKIGTSPSTSFQDTGVSGSNMYWYNIQAVDSAGKVGVGSDPALVATPAGSGTLPAPVITPNPDSQSATVDSPFTYTINASNSPNSYGAVIHGGTGLPGGLSLAGATISGTPTQAGTFTIDLSATNSAGMGMATLTLTIAPSNPNLPAAASNLQGASPNSSSIQLTWTDNSNNETGFRIERNLAVGGTGFAAIGTVGANVTTYTDPGLNSNWQYDYRVIAFNAAGDAAPSNTVTVLVLSQTTGPCDVNGDGLTNVVDVQQDVNAALGVTTCSPVYDINKDSLCNVIDVQRVTNAALGGACVSP